MLIYYYLDNTMFLLLPTVLFVQFSGITSFLQHMITFLKRLLILILHIKVVPRALNIL